MATQLRSTVTDFHFQRFADGEHQHGARRTEEPLLPTQPLQPRGITLRCIDEVEIANRAAEQCAGNLALTTKGKRVQR
ncbi:hypothetical protein D3C84_1206640 [compost metagenome]